jgi:hypothetical protein
MLVAGDGQEFGHLLDATRRHATSGKPTFCSYDPSRKALTPRHREQGCQPYFSRDGRWGFWIARPGGPIRRIDLRSGEWADIVRRDDTRIPPEFGHVYFPMVSPGQRLIAFGASGGEHDHFRADYEIFVAPLDPRTLELIGDAVRYTFNSATDRFPDVFLAGMELGRLRGEVPLAVALQAPDEEEDGPDASWLWSFGDGGSARGPRVEHTYRTPGQHRVEARRGDVVLRGAVDVDPAQPPRPVRALVRDSGREVEVLFDEPIDLREPRLRFAESGAAVSWEVGPDGQSLRVRPERPIERPDRLLLEGVIDRARPPNAMPPREFAVEPHDWPSRDDGLLFLWGTAQERNLVRDPETGLDRGHDLEPDFKARLDRNHAMVLSSGRFRVEHPRIPHRVRASGEFSVEATIRPVSLEPRLPGAIVSLARSSGNRNFALVQEGDGLALYLRTSSTPDAGARLPLLRLPSTGPHHVVVAYRPGHLAAYLDGERVMRSGDVRGDLDTWIGDADLSFGWERRGPLDWHGTLEGIAIYDRFVRGGEAEANAEAYFERIAEREPVDRTELRAVRRAASAAPTLQEIVPYRDGLVVHEYEVLDVLSGELGEPVVRVVHWALLNGARLPVADAAPGGREQLVLERLQDNPQVQAIYLADDLELDPDVPVFLDVNP